MSRMIWLIPLLVSACTGCQKSASSTEKAEPTTANDRVPVPTDRVAVVGGAPQTPGGNTDEARFHLHPDEGSLTIDKAEGKAGSELTSNIKVTPTGEFHVNTEFPIKLTLEPPTGVKLAKQELVAGGMDKAQGDAVAFSEKALSFAVKATADKAGTYDIKGTFKFAVCTNNNTKCLAKKQPITVTVAAN
ncbi:MAG: hypothetical protein ABI678_07645 [Kofleriaceae bacterium]